MSQNFIQSAIKRPGALTAKAAAAGMTVDAYARKHQHDPGQTGEQARFYLQVLKPGSKKSALAKAAAKK